MEIKNTSQLTWTPKIMRTLERHISSDTAAIFKSEWDRILNGMGFYMIPYCEESIERMKSAHFWHKIVNELLKHYSTAKIAKESGAPVSLIEKIAEDDSFDQQNIKFTVGEKILRLHRKVCQDA